MNAQDWLLEWNGGFSTTVPYYMIPPSPLIGGYWYSFYTSACSPGRRMNELKVILQI